MTTHHAYGGITFVFCAAACGDKIDPSQPLVDRSFECTSPESPFCPVQKIFVRSCALSGCHVIDGLAPMSLEPDVAYDNLINVDTISFCANGKRVVPGDPENSCLWQLLADDTMPQGGPPLPDADKETLRAWIEAGAME